MDKSYLIDDKRIIIQIELKSFDKEENPKNLLRYLCVEKLNGLFPSCQYYLNYYPDIIPPIPYREVLSFYDVVQAETWVKRNLIEILHDIGEVEAINFCNIRKEAYVIQKTKLEIDSKFLSPDTYKIDNTSYAKTKPLPTKTLYKDC